jgi:NADPH-dependent curcumin reductase
VRVEFLSIDPGIRNWISEGGSYVDPVSLGAVVPSFGIGQVVVSAAAGIEAGAVVTGQFGVREYATLDADQVDVVGNVSAPLPRYLGALGISGITAYFGIIEIASPGAGSTVVVSGAAGSVGSIAGQIAKLLGCRVIGIAGGAEKCEWITGALGFDAAIDYKACEVGAALDELAPDGVDVFFDNVGGVVLDSVLDHLRQRARVVLCGTVSQYNAAQWVGLRNHRALLVKRARMEGFLVFDYAERYPEALQQLQRWLETGQLVAVEDVVEGGVAQFPSALVGQFHGENRGKRVLRVVSGQP